MNHRKTVVVVVSNFQVGKDTSKEIWKIDFRIRFKDARDVAIQLPAELVQDRSLADAGIADQQDKTLATDDAVAKRGEHFPVMKIVVKARRFGKAAEGR